MKILHVISSLNKAAGTTTFVENVVVHLRLLGHDVDVLTKADYRKDGLWRNRHYDLIHIHAIWPPWLHRVSVWAHQRKIPVVWSTHGMTAPWSMKHKWWKKFPAWWLYQKRDLMRASAIHCTTELEQKWNRDLGFQNCFVVPLGTRLPANVEKESRKADFRTLLFVGRIYPVKALDRLIEAFARVGESVRRNWTLRFVGPDQAGHMAELMSLCDRLGLSFTKPEENLSRYGVVATFSCDSTRPQVEFVGPKFDQELDAEYDNCDALALVSHTENFGATVVDAMAHGKPVITSTKTPWKVVSDNKCGWWVDNEVVPLSVALADMMGLDDAARIVLGDRSRSLVAEHYTWSAVCDKILSGYNGVIR